MRIDSTNFSCQLAQSLRSLSVIALIERIVNDADHSALREFHNHRHLFRVFNSTSVRFAEYVQDLRKKFTSKPSQIVDDAHDLTIDKFSGIPDPSLDQEPAKHGPDCRHYFKAFLQFFYKNTRQKSIPLNSIHEETLAANYLQGLVRRHFYLSILECERRLNRTRNRYVWRINGGSVTVRFPDGFKGHLRREWLENHIPDIDLSRPGESYRIQEKIDAFFGLNSTACDNHVSYHPEDGAVNPPVFSDWYPNCPIDLVETIALEKAISIETQRPAIQSLGPDTIRNMVRAIFHAIERERYGVSDMANRFGISKSTVSRFAGNQWEENQENIPDLWQNTAHVVSKHPALIGAAQESGIWQTIVKVLKKN